MLSLSTSNLNILIKATHQVLDFLDVTLVSDDAKQFQAHKLVLSACSSFFKKILIGQSHPQPLVYLSGVQSSQLAPALDYIYRGQVVLPDTELETFLVVAQRLGLEGLAGEEQGLQGGRLDQVEMELTLRLVATQIRLCSDAMQYGMDLKHKLLELVQKVQNS